MRDDKHFSLRCCWTCRHCTLDILRGYECDAVGPNMGPIPLGGHYDIHRPRPNCKAYVRG